jgi:predicted small lipoprotein YifL
MSKSVRLVLVLAMVSAIAACAKKEEVMVEPVTVETVDTGKYK